jgi:hypothetical protein
MRKSTSRITKLPVEVREEINRKMDQGWAYRLIRKWLFEQVAECDVPALELVTGDSYSLAWVRAAKSTEHAWHHCELALGNWFRTHHQVWLKLQVQGSESMRLVKRAGMLTQVASNRVASSQGSGAGRKESGEAISIEGGDVLMRSVLIDAISTIATSARQGRVSSDSAQGKNIDPKDIAQLANAWARLNQTNTEAEKLQLKTQSAFELACEGLGKEIKDNPEALALFYKMRDVMAEGKKAEEKSRNSAGCHQGGTAVEDGGCAEGGVRSAWEGD